MKIKAVVSAVMALSMASSGLVLAQGRGDRGDRDDRGGQQERRDNDARNQQDRRDADADMRRGRGTNARGSYNGRGPDGRGPPGQLKKEEWRDGRRGAGPHHAYYRGDRLPMEYRHRTYVVDNWHSHQLSAPPRGYHWVQTGSDYVLIAIASGIIAQLILGN